MKEAPPPPPEKAPASADGPLTKHALEKMRGIVTGNGIDPKKIELIGAEETELVIEADLHLTPDIMRQQKRYAGAYAGGRDKAATQLQNPQQLETAAASIKDKIAQDNEWIKNACRQLKGEPGEGWGLEDADITLDEMVHVFYTTEICPSCGGHGGQACNVCNGSGQLACQRCQSSGRELCYACNGSGIYNNDSTTYCPVCKGATMATCRVCNGLRQVNCHQCTGSGKLACTACNGDGKATLEEKITPIVHCAFATRDTRELPSGFRRAISRGGGLQSLTRGHAAITMHEVDESQSERILIPYTATLPYAELRVRVAGKAMRMTVMGHKRAILDVPPFMDARLETDLAPLEAQPAQADGLKKAMKWRVMRDAFEIMQQGDDAKALRRRYPFGFSPAMLARAQKTVMRIVQSQTRANRLLAGGAFVAALALVYWIALSSNVRAAMAEKISIFAPLVFDVLVCAATAFGGQRLLQFVTQHHLRKSLGDKAVGRIGAQKMDLFDLGIMAGAVLLYLVMIGVMKAKPDWLGLIIGK